MLKKSRIIEFCLISGFLLSFPVFAKSSEGLFSANNFAAINKDPLELFSSVNECRFKALLGKKDFNSFRESMSLETNEDEPNYVAISGSVKGLFTIYEGFFRMSKDQKVWIAYLYDSKVHYFTNDEATVNKPPQILMDWSSRFKEAKWINKQLAVKPDNCK